MKKISLFVVALFAIMLTSCASYQQTGAVEESCISMSTDLEMVLDLDNVVPVTATVKTTKNFGFKSSDYKTVLDDGTSSLFGGTSTIKRRALAKAKEAAGVDVILEPQYKIEKHSYFFGLFGSETCTVTGFGAKVKGFKKK